MAKSNIKEKKEDGRVLAALKAVQSDMATMQTEMKTLQETVSTTKRINKFHHCNNCSTKETVSGEFNICSVCKLVRYCSRNCQKKHWDEHKTLCTAIKNLYTSTERGLGDSADENVFISHLTPSERNTVAKSRRKVSRSM
jgi:hypothetical protein